MLDPHDTCAKEAGVSEVFEFQTSASCFYLFYFYLVMKTWGKL